MYMHASKQYRPIRQPPLSHALLRVHASPCNVCVCQGTHEWICMHLCSGFCSNLCDGGGVLGVCGAMASDWSRENLFHLTSADTHQLKLKLAQRCDIHYCNCNQDKDMGFTSNGVMGLTAEKLGKSAKAMQEMMCDTTPSTQHQSRKIAR